MVESLLYHNRMTIKAFRTLEFIDDELTISTPGLPEGRPTTGGLRSTASAAPEGPSTDRTNELEEIENLREELYGKTSQLAREVTEGQISKGPEDDNREREQQVED
ncbi:hypothetical protein BHE74_00027612 [Ensete ventricosum]|nr:hypothetical protein BHE74_00027612 [Ensete ventricosum]